MNQMQICRVGIIGANPVSVGMAVSLLDADVPVTLFDTERESLDRILALARSGYENAVAAGELGANQRERRIGLLAGTVNFHHLKDCDLIVDAECADKESKESLFRRLDQTAKLGAVLATRASNVNLDHVGACTRRPGDVLGLEVSACPNSGEIWKIVPGKHTSATTLERMAALTRKIDKAAGGSDVFHGMATDAAAAASG